MDDVRPAGSGVDRRRRARRLSGRACSRASRSCCGAAPAARFRVVTGTSAGAVSAIALASDPAHFRHAVYAIEKVWREFRVHHVIKADARQRAKSGLHWILALLTRRLAGPSAALAVRQHAAVGAAAQETGFRRHPARHVQEAPAGGRHLRHQLLGCGFGHFLCFAPRRSSPGRGRFARARACS